MIDSTLTNADGGYYKKITYDKGEAFQLRAIKSGYYWNDDVILSGIQREHNLNLMPNRNFIIRFQNVNPVLITDSFYWFNRTSENGNYNPLEPRWFVGQTDTTIFIPIHFNDNNWYFQYQYRDSAGVWNINSIKPYCTQSDTTTLLLTF